MNQYFHNRIEDQKTGSLMPGTISKVSLLSVRFRKVMTEEEGALFSRHNRLGRRSAPRTPEAWFHPFQRSPRGMQRTMKRSPRPSGRCVCKPKNCWSQTGQKDHGLSGVNTCLQILHHKQPLCWPDLFPGLHQDCAECFILFYTESRKSALSGNHALGFS